MANSRMYNHQHNMLFGNIGMAQAGMNNICQGKTTTPDAKLMAMHISKELVILADLLQKRVNQDGAVTDLSIKRKEARAKWLKEMGIPDYDAD